LTHNPISPIPPLSKSEFLSLKRDLGELERVDLEAFIEHEQDRGMHNLAGSDQAMLLRFMGYHPQNASFEALNGHFHGQKRQYKSGRFPAACR